MMIKNLLLIACIGIPISAASQVTFTNSNGSLVNGSLTSGCAIGVSDMNGDGLDDLVRLNNANSLEIEYQNANGIFTRYTYGSISGSQWGLCIADVDKNGYNDILAGGAYNNLKLLKANGSGTAYTNQNLSGPNIFLQSVNFADIDNNGTIDLFGCHDDGISSAYNNDGTGTMTYDLGLINALSTIPSDNSGNYGSIWMDYDNDGDLDLYISKCRLGVGDPNDGRRVNLLFQNDGSGNYTDVAQAAGLRPLAQSWSANFEDIDNDGDLDCVLINHDITSLIYENNGNGTFTDITSSSGISSELSGLGSGGIQVAMEDFDNDTYVDILITARSVAHYLFKNNGNKSFSVMPTPFPGNRIQSAATGDLNNDGFIDIIAGYASGYNSPTSNPDILFLNNGNANNWSEIKLKGLISNSNGIGARIELHSASGMQIREVRSGESYGTMNSLMTHFGLATQTAITKIVVHWPSGITDELLSPAINQSHVIVEGDHPLSTDSFATEFFNIYPNPTRDFVNISTLEFMENLSFDIFDISGKKVMAKSSELNSVTNIDLRHLNSGIYFLHLKSGNKNYIHKLIKE